MQAVNAERAGAGSDGSADHQVGLAGFGAGYFAVLPVEPGGCAENFGEGFFRGEPYGLGA